MISRDEYVIVNLWHGIHSTRNIWLCQHVAHWTVPLTRAGVLQFQEKQFSQPATQRFWNYIAIKLGGNSRLFIKPGVLPGGWWERHLPYLFFCCCLLALNYFPLTISWGELGVAHCLGEMWGQYPLSIKVRTGKSMNCILLIRWSHWSWGKKIYYVGF